MEKEIADEVEGPPDCQRAPGRTDRAAMVVQSKRGTRDQGARRQQIRQAVHRTRRPDSGNRDPEAERRNHSTEEECWQMADHRAKAARGRSRGRIELAFDFVVGECRPCDSRQSQQRRALRAGTTIGQNRDRRIEQQNTRTAHRRSDTGWHRELRGIGRRSARVHHRQLHED